MAASTLTGGMIDPTRQAEYPIILGERLKRNSDKPRSQLINIQYNYKTKAATSNQRSVITKSSHSRDHFNLKITDKAPNAEQNVLTYSYQGSVDPAQSVSESQNHNLVLVFDPKRKAFVLEPVATQLNFNLRSAPAKTEKQVIQQYPQLRTLQEDEHTSGDDRADQTTGNDDGPADDENPYDFRHFLPKEKDSLDTKLASGNATPEQYANTSKANTPLITATKPTSARASSPRPRPRPKTQSNPLRQKKPATDTAQKSEAVPPRPRPKSPLRAVERQAPDIREKKRPVREEPEEIVFESSKSSPSDTGTGAVSSQKTVPSPGSNIIIDGDLIIDMGSPPPARPFRVNPAHFSSNNTPANNEDEEDGDEDIEDLRLPSPVPAAQTSEPTPHIRVEPAQGEHEDNEEDEDFLVAEMEAAFEEDFTQPTQAHIPTHQYVPSDDESEVSEEE
ncbi:RNA polymerase II transcription elongation factor-domain-containing protein [Aspergillus karnatakaensis]|uniref:RNA polymerase II transcription elongation factor-domain-containing protein n=1 Tax=Aspergillus karnatakaensis TaxID=1810916 RepID=UPI003CCE3C2B